MTARKSWNNERPAGYVDGHDVGYERAMDIARRSGLSLGAWLNGVISDASQRAVAHPSPFDSQDHEFPRRPHAPGRNGQRSAKAAPAQRPGNQDNVQLSKMFQRLASLAERVSSAELQAQQALALAERRLEAADRAGAVTARHVKAFTHEVDHAHSDLAAVEREARRAVRDLIGETRTLGAGELTDDPRLSAIVSAIRSVEARLDHISDRLNKPAAPLPPLHDDGRLAKIEAQLVDIARQLQDTPSQPAFSGDTDLSETLRQIASRQRELENSVSSRDQADLLHHQTVSRLDGESLRDIQERLGDLAAQIASARHQPPFDDRLNELPERFETLRRSLERPAVQPQLDQLLDEIRQLDTKVSDARHAGIDHANLSRLESQLDDMSALLRAGQPGDVLAYMKTIGDKLEGLKLQGLQPRQDIATIERLREDILELRAQIVERPVDGMAARGAPDERLDDLRHRMEQIQSLLSMRDETPQAINVLAGRIDALATQLLANGTSDTTQRMIAELRGRVEELASHPPDTAAFSAIEQRLTLLVDKIERAQAEKPRSDPSYGEVDSRLKRLTELMESQRETPPSANVVQSLEKHISEFRRSAEGSDRRVSETLSSVHEALTRLNERLQENASAPNAPAPSAPVTRAAAKPGAAVPAALPALQPEAKPGRGMTSPAAKPPVHPDQSALSAAREAAARAAELQRLHDDRGELDLPLEPGSGRPRALDAKASRKSPPARAETTNQAPRADDPIRAARIAMQRHHAVASEGAAKSSLLSSLVSALRRKGKSKTATTPAPPSEMPLAKPALAKPRKISALLIRVGVAVSMVAIVLSAIRIVLSLGQPGGDIATPPREERPVSTSQSAPASDDTARADADIASNADKRNETIAASSVTTRGADALPPLPEGITSQRLKQALEAGNPRAYFDVAVRLADGRSVPRNVEAAIPWLVLAGERDHAPAYYRLGNIYEKGLGPKRDIAQAVGAYSKGATLGNRKSMHNLATLYAAGIATGAADYERAFPLFEQAAELGLVDSQFNLAVLLVNGLGTKQNLGEAYKWFTVAAQNGDKEAGKKRDEIAARLNGQALVDARLAAQNFRPKAIAAAANEDVPPALLFEDNPLTAPAAGGPQATPNLGISVAPTAKRS